MVCLLLCSSCQVICYVNYYLSFITWLTFATIVKSDEYQSFLLWGEGVREGWKPHYTGVENVWHADQKIGSVLVNVNDADFPCTGVTWQSINNIPSQGQRCDTWPWLTAYLLFSDCANHLRTGLDPRSDKIIIRDIVPGVPTVQRNESIGLKLYGACTPRGWHARPHAIPYLKSFYSKPILHGSSALVLTPLIRNRSDCPIDCPQCAFSDPIFLFRFLCLKLFLYFFSPSTLSSSSSSFSLLGEIVLLL